MTAPVEPTEREELARLLETSAPRRKAESLLLAGKMIEHGWHKSAAPPEAPAPDADAVEVARKMASLVPLVEITRNDREDLVDDFACALTSYATRQSAELRKENEYLEVGDHTRAAEWRTFAERETQRADDAERQSAEAVAAERERAALIAEKYKFDAPDRVCCIGRGHNIATRIRAAEREMEQQTKDQRAEQSTV